MFKYTFFLVNIFSKLTKTVSNGSKKLNSKCPERCYNLCQKHHLVVCKGNTI